MKKLALLTILLGLTAGSAQAAVVATQSFVDFGTPTADGSATGNINTATSFAFGDLASFLANTGALAGLPSQTFGQVSFALGSATSLTFASSSFWLVH